jgi:hypothetical protein
MAIIALRRFVSFMQKVRVVCRRPFHGEHFVVVSVLQRTLMPAASEPKALTNYVPNVIPSLRYISLMSRRIRASSGERSPLRVFMTIGDTASVSFSGR